MRSRAGAPPAAHPLTRPVRAVHVCLAGWDHVTELEVVPSCDPILFFAADGRHLPARLPLPPDRLWILRPAGREIVAAGEFRTIAESPVPFGWEGWHLELASLEQVSSVALRGGPAHAVPGQPRPRLLLGEPLPGVTTLDGSPVYPEPPRLWLPDAVRWHVGVRPATGGTSVVSREISQGGPADIWDGVPRPILGSVRHHRARSAGPRHAHDGLRGRRCRRARRRARPTVVVTPPQPRAPSSTPARSRPSPSPRPGLSPGRWRAGPRSAPAS